MADLHIIYTPIQSIYCVINNGQQCHAYNLTMESYIVGARPP